MAAPGFSRAQLALRKSSDPSVQAFPKRMIADHKSLDAKSESLAKRKRQLAWRHFDHSRGDSHRAQAAHRPRVRQGRHGP
ncbi:DUF4142 domain-containing protein [Caballeronia sp. GAFFF1]|uniref:DUF4142 domain-containing protein n=1 Tax=Caballeronia sp. GAFFF1 TaxID=2921779 RepID=UPI0032EAD644